MQKKIKKKFNFKKFVFFIIFIFCFDGFVYFGNGITVFVDADNW